jgi:hypothetical protein
MPRNVIPIRGSEAERARWEAASGNTPFSAWARRVLNEEADRVLAERRFEESGARERVEVISRVRPQGDLAGWKPDPK